MNRYRVTKSWFVHADSATEAAQLIKASPPLEYDELDATPEPNGAVHVVLQVVALENPIAVQVGVAAPPGMPKNFLVYVLRAAAEHLEAGRIESVRTGLTVRATDKNEDGDA